MNDQGVAVPVQSRSVADVFNLIAAGYDREALRFFPYAADRLIARLKPAHGIKILDIATGTGVVALAAAQAVGAAGRVVGIDLAEGMLEQAEKKLRQFGIAGLGVGGQKAQRNATLADARQVQAGTIVAELTFRIHPLPTIAAPCPSRKTTHDFR